MKKVAWQPSVFRAEVARHRLTAESFRDRLRPLIKHLGPYYLPSVHMVYRWGKEGSPGPPRHLPRAAVASILKVAQKELWKS